MITPQMVYKMIVELFGDDHWGCLKSMHYAGRRVGTTIFWLRVRCIHRRRRLKLIFETERWQMMISIRRAGDEIFLQLRQMPPDEAVKAFEQDRLMLSFIDDLKTNYGDYPLV